MKMFPSRLELKKSNYDVISISKYEYNTNKNAFANIAVLHYCHIGFF